MRPLSNKEGLYHAYFVTGATGFVSSAVVKGDCSPPATACSALARSEAGAAAVRAAGAEAVLGSLEDANGLQRAASAVDGVIHTAFNHDFSKFAANCELDRRAIEALGAPRWPVRSGRCWPPRASPCKRRPTDAPRPKPTSR